MERAFDWSTLSTLASYRDTLAALHAFHAAWEPRAAALLADSAFFDPRRRAALLADDLRHLGPGPAATPPRLPDLPTRAAALGSMYVVEGSTLGGTLIARHVAATLHLQPGAGLSYHTGHGPRSGPMWREFCARLDAALRPGPELEQAVAAAKQTFACLGRCLAAPQPVT